MNDSNKAIALPEGITKDWVVTELIDRGPGHFYRYQTIGINLNYPEGHPNRKFSWSVPTICERYDLSAITTTETK